ncbi:MAG: AsmA family protein [Candidatus Azobacteroides sp.]|nr:AsmA family protein [Candidatus Azobacteroides sp.]
MKKFLKIAGIILLVVLLALIILPFLFKGKIVEFVKNEINQTMNARVDFDRVGLNFFRSFPDASVSLDNLRVIGIDEFESDTLFYAEKISGTINLKSLFGNSGYEIKKISADRACVHAHVLESGKANWDIMKEDTTEMQKGEETSAFKLLLKEVSVRNSDVYFDNDSSHINMGLQNVNLVLSGDMTADETQLKTNFTVDTLRFLMDKIPYLSKAKANGDAVVIADLKNMKFTFADNHLQLNEIKANLDGWISYPDAESMDMDIRLNAPDVQFKDVLSLIPAIYSKDFKDIKTAGKVSLEASAKGLMKEEILPAFDMKLYISDAFFQYPSLPESVKNIRTNIHIYSKGGSMDNTLIDIADSHFEMGGNPFDFNLNLSTPISDPNIRLSAVGKLDLGKIKDVYPIENMELNGNLNANLKLATRMSFIDKAQYDKVEASGTLNISEMQIQSEGKDSIRIHNAGLSFSPRYVDLTGFSAEIGKNDLAATGKLENFIPYFMKNETLKGNLTVSSNYLNLNDFMTESTTSSNDSTQIEIIEIPKNLDFDLNGNFKQLIFDRLNMTQVVGQIIVKDGKAEMKNLAMNALGGKMNVSGYYDTGKNPQQPDVSLNLDVQEVSFAQTFSTFLTIKQLAPIFENLTGNYSTKFQMTSPLGKDFMPILASLTAGGLLTSGNVAITGNQVLNGLAATLKNDSLKNLKIKDLKLPFSVDSGRVSTKPFDVRFGDGTLNLQGSTGLDQTIDYKAKVNLAGKLANQYLNNVTVLIGGTFTSPKFSLDVKNAADQLLGNLTNSVLKGDNQNVPLSEQVTGKVNEQVEKQTEAIRNQAKESGDKLIAEAENQGQKLIDQANKTSNPLAKVAAVKAAEASAKKLKDEAQKQADKLNAEAEKQIQTLKDKSGQ